MIFMKEKITALLPTECPWRDTLYWFDTIISTNDQAKKMAQAGAPHGTVLIADHQTGGRGRMGRSFSSPKGMGIYLSVILRPDCPAQQLMHLTCTVAVAMCDAIEDACHFRPGIKWINDLVAANKKLGGILTELSVTAGSGLLEYAIVGIGINCSQTPWDFPPEIRDLAISLQSVTGSAPNKEHLAAAMMKHLWEMDKKLLSRDFLTSYRQNCVTLNKPVAILRGEKKQYATALDIDGDGGLIVRYADGTEETVSSGEVSVRGMYGYM